MTREELEDLLAKLLYDTRAPLSAFLLRLDGLCDSDVQDIMQDASILLWGFMVVDNDKTPGEYRAWLFTTAYRLAIDLLRSRCRRGMRQIPEDLPDKTSAADEPYIQLQNREEGDELIKEIEILRKARAGLSPKLRDAYDDLMNGLKHKEIAELRKITERQSKYHRGTMLDQLQLVLTA